MVSIEQRCSTLNGNVLVCTGNSGSGKSYLTTRAAIVCALTVGGGILAYDPTGHIRGNFRSQERFAITDLDRVRSRDGDDSAVLARLDLFRNRDRSAFYGEGHEDAFVAALKRVVLNGHGGLFGSVVIDEGRVARSLMENELRSWLPLLRNGKAFGYLTSHRLMAAVPEIRATARGMVCWDNPDPTSKPDAVVERAKAEGWNIYSDPMGGEGRRFYRGVQFVNGDMRPFELERTAKLPDWMILPATVTRLPEQRMYQ